MLPFQAARHDSASVGLTGWEAALSLKHYFQLFAYICPWVARVMWRDELDLLSRAQALGQARLMLNVSGTRNMVAMHVVISSKP